VGASLAVIWWRDIPAQVVAREGSRTHSVALDDRFQEAIDRAAFRAGLTDTDAYLDQWRRQERPCGSDLETEVDREAQLLEADFPAERLAALIAGGGTVPSA